MTTTAVAAPARGRAIADETMSRIRKSKDSRGVVDEGVRVCINSPSTTAPAMTKAVMKWGTKTHTHFWPRGGSHQVTHLALTLWLMQDWGGLTCKDEQRMGGADDSSWGWLWWRPLLTLWLFFSLLCSIVFVKFWRDDQHRKPTVFFNGERLLGELARFWWIKLFPIVFWWGFKLAKTNLVRLKNFEPVLFGEVKEC